jgi:2-oxo-4-hydroxy-4-carboxy-5-ureidoimidazoline decarboxylase
VNLARFNALSADEAERVLRKCCAAPRWVRAVAAGRPYPSPEALHAAAEATLSDADVDDGLAGHPRVGERTTGALSRREQSGVASAPPEVLAALADGNRAYEDRFGHVYLVCATDRSAAELLAVLRERLGHDAVTERAVVRTELVKINRIRLDRLVVGEAA